MRIRTALGVSLGIVAADVTISFRIFLFFGWWWGVMRFLVEREREREVEEEGIEREDEMEEEEKKEKKEEEKDEKGRKERKKGKKERRERKEGNIQTAFVMAQERISSLFLFICTIPFVFFPW
jgi:hypothetical protein